MGFTNRPQTAASTSSAHHNRNNDNNNKPPPPLPPSKSVGDAEAGGSTSKLGGPPPSRPFLQPPPSMTAAKKPYVHESGATEGGLMRPVTQTQKVQQSLVRDRINSRWFNLRPVLKGVAKGGKVHGPEIREALAALNLGLTDEQVRSS